MSDLLETNWYRNPDGPEATNLIERLRSVHCKDCCCAMLLVEILDRKEATIQRLVAALHEASDSFRNAGLSVDADDCEDAIKESLGGGNPGEPTACHTAEERGIAVATGAGQLPDDNPESTSDSVERRSPGGIPDAPSPDESNRQSYGWVIEGAWSHITQPIVRLRERWFYFKHWLRIQVCRLRGHKLETGHHLQASLFCTRCGRVQFYYHSQGLIVPATASLEYLNKLGINNP